MKTSFLFFILFGILGIHESRAEMDVIISFPRHHDPSYVRITPVGYEKVGEIKSWNWLINGGPFRDGPKIYERNLNFGKNKINLTVEGKNGRKRSILKEVEIVNSPLRDLDCDFSPGEPDNISPVYFSAEDSKLGNLNPSHVHWDFGDGTSANGARVKHLFKVPGKYEVICSIQDSFKRKLVVVRNFRVDDGKNPMAKMEVRDLHGSMVVNESDIYNGLVLPDSLKMTAESAGEKNPPVRADWDFGDGTKGYGIEVFKTYSLPGTYKIRLNSEYLDGSKRMGYATAFYGAGGCLSMEGQNACLKVENAIGPILPSSQKEWVVSNSLGIKPSGLKENVSDSSGNYIYFENSNGRVDALPFSRVEGDKIFISNKVLQTVNDATLDRFHLMVGLSGSEATNDIVGMSYSLLFGTEKLSVESTDPGTSVFLENKQAQIQQYYKFEQVGEILIKDLPRGKYSLKATQGLKEFEAQVELIDGKLGKIEIDFGSIEEKDSPKTILEKRRILDGILFFYGSTSWDERQLMLEIFDLVKFEGTDWIKLRKEFRVRDIRCTKGMMLANIDYSLRIRKDEAVKDAHCEYQKIIFAGPSRFRDATKATNVSVGNIKSFVQNLTDFQAGLNAQEINFERSYAPAYMQKVLDDIGLSGRYFFVGDRFGFEPTRMSLLMTEPFVLKGKSYPAFHTVDVDTSNELKAVLVRVLPPN